MVIFIGVISLGLIQRNLNLDNAGDGAASRVKAFNENITSQEMADVIFGQNYDRQDFVNTMLEKQVKLITTRKSFFASLGVVKKHEAAIRSVAQAAGVPEDVAIGVAFLENGGSETAKSSAGAVGIYQIMPGTMTSLGYKTSDRNDPNINIEAGLKYLRKNYNLFDDWGLTVWSYHAGEGNVCRAIKIHAKTSGIELPGCFENPQATRNYINSADITVHKLLSNSSVQNQLTNRLNDDSAGYPYKVMATAYLFDLAKRLGPGDFAERVLLLNAQTITLAEFFQS